MDTTDSLFISDIPYIGNTSLTILNTQKIIGHRFVVLTTFYSRREVKHWCRCCNSSCHNMGVF
uniref:Uncharacterized protein n=1 Tax=Ciona intestinalis TaxID=7719 RepID=H2XNP1_CIOIN